MCALLSESWESGKHTVIGLMLEEGTHYCGGMASCPGGKPTKAHFAGQLSKLLSISFSEVYFHSGFYFTFCKVHLGIECLHLETFGGETHSETSNFT